MLFIGRIGVNMRLRDRRDRAVRQIFDQPANEERRYGRVEVEVAEILEQLLMHLVQELQASRPVPDRKVPGPAASEFLGKMLYVALRIVGFRRCHSLPSCFDPPGSRRAITGGDAALSMRGAGGGVVKARLS